MRFSRKIFLCVMTLTAAAFSAGGTALMLSSFSASLDRETSLAREENRLARFSFEASAGTRPSGGLTRATVQQIAQSTESAMGGGQLKLRVTDEIGRILYDGAGPAHATREGDMPEPNARTTTVARVGDRYYVRAACRTEVGGAPYTLESFRDVTSVYRARDGQYGMFRLLTLALLAATGAATLGLARWLTRPTAALADAARRFAAGERDARAPVRSTDEIGLVADAFNAMADQINDQLSALQDAVRRQEDFTASFAHELKTPLTSVIGYADMLRSRELEPETRTLAADYIFREGKRLERLSLTLLDMFVLRGDPEMRPFRTSPFFDGLRDFLTPRLTEAGIATAFDVGDAVVLGEPDLVRTLLYNLIDNARKAMERGGVLTVTGRCETDTYRVSVRDNGKGIPPEELARITEPFYMIDKARARTQGGAGLGLALCDRIARRHGGPLFFRSVVGAGTEVSFRLPLAVASDEGDRKEAQTT